MKHLKKHGKKAKILCGLIHKKPVKKTRRDWLDGLQYFRPGEIPSVNYDV